MRDFNQRINKTLIWLFASRFPYSNPTMQLRDKTERLLRSPVQQTRDQAVLVDPKPCTAGLEILPANDSGIFQEQGRRQGRAAHELVAIRGDHDRIIGEALEINRQRTHRNQSWQERQGGDKGPAPNRTCARRASARIETLSSVTGD